MPELQVRKEQREQSAAKRLPNDFFSPAFPFERFLGFSPFGWVRGVTHEMDRMLHTSARTVGDEVWAPTLDIHQCNGTMTVIAELAGVNKDEVNVQVTEDAVIIEGDRRREHKEDHEGFHRCERNYGHFYRSIPLPEGAKTEQVKAELSEGMLKISLPVTEVKKHVRQVTIEESPKLRPTAA